MARRKKDGAKAQGIQSKKGMLYVVIPVITCENGKKKYSSDWIRTGLKDTPENVKKAVEFRNRQLSKKSISTTDRNISLADYCDDFMDRKKREISDTTYAAYGCRAKNIKDYFKDAKVKELNKLQVEAFLDSLFDKNKMQPRTVKDVKTFLNGIMEQAVKEGLISYNPVKEVAINKTLAAKNSKAKNNDEEFFSYEEAQRFLSNVKGHKLYELFYITLFFGLRREEVLGLKWTAIDFRKKEIKIMHTVTKGTKVNRENTTKTKSSVRTYPIKDEQISLFQRIKEREDENRKLFGNCYIDNDYVFKHENGALYHPDYPTKAFKKIIAGINNIPHEITFHGLRKSCVSILVHEGMDIKSIQQWVGHADINTTLSIYTKIKENDAKCETANAMSKLITIE